MCDTIVALGSATEEGFTLFGKNSDREPDEAQNILIVPRKKHDSNETVQCSYLTIPQVPETARVLLCQPFWMFGAEMGANEYGVVIGNEAIFTKRNYLSFSRMISKIVIKIKGGKLKMKRNKVKWLVILSVVSVILFLVVSQGFSQSLSDILKKAESNYKNFNQDFKDMAIVFDAKIYTPEGEMLSEMKLFLKGEKSRSETLMQFPEAADIPEGMGSMLVVVIFDGQDTWMISSFVGKKKLTTVQAEEQMYYQTGMNWWKFISDKTKYIGTEKIEGRECYILELEIERESPYKRIWVDKDRLFLVQAEGDSSDGNKVRTTFSDFRKAKGSWELPYKIEVFINEVQTMTVLTKSLEINKGLSDDLFDVNKVEVSGPNMQEMMQNMMQQGKNN